MASLVYELVLKYNHNHFKLLMDTSLHNSTVHGAVLSQVAASAALNECGLSR
jgi:hypothetical protein